jgi:signal peptidase I
MSFLSAPLVRRAWREIRAMAIPMLAILAAKSSFGTVNYVPSGSMSPTILVGDAVIVNNLAYSLRIPFTSTSVARWNTPARGDIVVCFEPGDGTRLVKRVIGVPGDVVELRGDHLWLNGRPQEVGPYVTIPARPAWRNFGPVVVLAGQYFMMGDNRDNSKDSRYFGSVPLNQVIGRAQYVLLSADPSHYLLPRSGRFLTRLN